MGTQSDNQNLSNIQFEIVVICRNMDICVLYVYVI